MVSNRRAASIAAASWLYFQPPRSLGSKSATSRRVSPQLFPVRAMPLLRIRARAQAQYVRPGLERAAAALAAAVLAMRDQLHLTDRAVALSHGGDGRFGL